MAGRGRIVAGPYAFSAPVEPILIAPPGTALDEPGWSEPPPGTVLRWDMDTGERPSVAVRRGDVLLCSGGPLELDAPVSDGILTVTIKEAAPDG